MTLNTTNKVIQLINIQQLLHATQPISVVALTPTFAADNHKHSLYATEKLIIFNTL